MRKRLLLLDLVLLTLVLVLGGRLRQIWLEARKRESVVIGQPLKQLPPPPHAPLPPVAPLTAASYSDVAQKMLFSPDRNPTVVIEVAKRKPMPSLPAFFGLIDLGHGPTAIMAEGPGAKHEEVRYGEKIGEFKLVRIKGGQVELEWDGELIVKKIEDLTEHAAPAGAAAATQASAPPPPPVAPKSLSPQQLASPGIELSPGRKACQPGDATPAGAVVDGFRKVVKPFPFGGESCEWVAAR
jgi:hypothetical protein